MVNAAETTLTYVELTLTDKIRMALWWYPKVFRWYFCRYLGWHDWYLDCCFGYSHCRHCDSYYELGKPGHIYEPWNDWK